MGANRVSSNANKNVQGIKACARRRGPGQRSLPVAHRVVLWGRALMDTDSGDSEPTAEEAFCGMQTEFRAFLALLSHTN